MRVQRHGTILAAELTAGGTYPERTGRRFSLWLPIIPWLGVSRYLAISTREAERHITKGFGYYDTGLGKGSHRHFHCPGRAPITLPSNRESLSPTVQRQIANALGYSNIRELAQRC